MDLVLQIVQIGTLLALLVYVFYTGSLARSNKVLAEYAIRPVAGVLVSPKSEATRLNTIIRNYTSTHAMGLVRVRLFADNKEILLQNPAYEGKELWYFPARQTVRGNYEFSGRLRAHEISESGANLKIVIYVYYKI